MAGKAFGVPDRGSLREGAELYPKIPKMAGLYVVNRTRKMQSVSFGERARIRLFFVGGWERQMAAEKSVDEISCRFGKDRLEIVEYVNFMRDQCAVHVQEVAELNATLARFSLPELPTREYLGTDHHLTPSEIADLVGGIDRITSAIDRVTRLEHGLG